MKFALMSLLRRIKGDLLITRSSEALRESAILWLVFALLDKFVVGELTVAWTVGNCGAALGIWTVSLYIEVYGDWTRR